MPDILNEPQSILSAAKADFESAYAKGRWHKVFNNLVRSNNELFSFDEVRKSLPAYGQHDAGMKQIEIDKIVGSVGRYNDFDREFLPIRTHSRERWESIDVAHLRDVVLPPIEAYQIGSVYFVKDGNHRVSVARERGQAFIDAAIIQIDVPVEITPDMDIDALILQLEQVDFLEKTQLNKLCPGAQVELTLPGGYIELIEHISVHRWFMGEQRKAEVSWEAAVIDWFDTVYMPLVEVLRQGHVLDDFPGRKEADLYLWIIEHLWYLREEQQEDISLEEAAVHFTEKFSPTWQRRLVRFFRRLNALITGRGWDEDA
jgi:hypothetical protein